MTTIYTKFLTITRDAAGLITSEGTWTRLAPESLRGLPGSVWGHHVVSVEPDRITNWGQAEAIGMVQSTMNGDNIEPPFLAFLT